MKAGLSKGVASETRKTQLKLLSIAVRDSQLLIEQALVRPIAEDAVVKLRFSRIYHRCF